MFLSSLILSDSLRLNGSKSAANHLILTPPTMPIKTQSRNTALVYYQNGYKHLYGLKDSWFSLPIQSSLTHPSHKMSIFLLNSNLLIFNNYFNLVGVFPPSCYINLLVNCVIIKPRMEHILQIFGTYSWHHSF